MSCDLTESNTYNALNTTPNFGIVGTDGVVPIYNPNAKWDQWNLNEIFTGTVGEGKYVPKVKDYVVDPDTFTWYIVDHIDPVTLVPTLREIFPNNLNNSSTIGDNLFGQHDDCCETFRMYIDKSVTPYTCAVDMRLLVSGTMSTYAKIFIGPLPGRVISKMYDTSGFFTSENVPLELVAIDSHINYTVKTVGVFYCTDDLIDGELVTLVVYSDTGSVVSKKNLVVYNSAYIRDTNTSQKYISHISLESPFLSTVDPHLIEFPLNIPNNALNLWGRVHYSDGSTLRLPVDSGKFRMLGIDQYLSSIVGQQLDLVLRYQLGPNETAYAGINNDNTKYITEPYKLITINPNNSFAVKLFGYPVFIDQATGYRMKWYLLNLDRNVYFDVTSNVVFDASTGIFDPTAYGYLQRKQVSINLRDVSSTFMSYTHTQIVEIVLLGTPNVVNSPWKMSNESVANRPMYGENLLAKTTGNSSVVDITSEITDSNIWLEKNYFNTFPMVNPVSEMVPPTPTHMKLINGASQVEVSIDNWNAGIDLGTIPALYSNLDIIFFKRTSTNDIFLSVSSLIIKN